MEFSFSVFGIFSMSGTEVFSTGENLGRVRQRMALAARRAGRDPDEIRLVAVTKGQPLEVVRAAFEQGLRDFGENRVEEALPKMQAAALGPACSWHMIGHVQSRKAGDVAPNFALVHSVDSLKLARRLDRFAGEGGRRLPVLIECNVSGEASKSGYPAQNASDCERLLPELEELVSLASLEVRGLMTMAPYTAAPEESREVFRRLRRLREYLAARIPSSDWGALSMGMTDDFEVAIEEGATIIRVGRALFGERG